MVGHKLLATVTECWLPLIIAVLQMVGCEFKGYLIIGRLRDRELDFSPARRVSE